MKHLLASETLKLRTLLLPRAVIAVGAVMSGLVGYAVVSIAAADGATPTVPQLATSNVQALWFLTVIVAVLATAGEYQHHTMSTTLLQAPRRAAVLVAKATVTAAYGAGLILIGAGAAVAAGVVWLQMKDLPIHAAVSDIAPAIGSSVLLGSLWAVLAVGLGALVRNSTVALVSVLVWKFVIENVIPIVTNAPGIQRWLPSYAADAALNTGDAARLLAPLAGGLLFAAYAAVIVLAGSLVFVHRDPV